MAVRIGDVTIRIGANTNQLEYSLRKAEKSLQASADKFKELGASLTLGITAPVTAAGAAAIKMASDYEESLNKVRVAFGESATSVEEFAKTTLENIGLAEGSALEMASLFGDMATSMGLTQPAAAEMSKSLVTLAGDLASFKNIGIEEAQTALAGVFTGETESLKRLGVVMTEANVQAYALTQGITKKLNAMTQAEKISLRYAYVMSVTKNAQGDFARTSGGAANQMRTFQETLKEAGQSLGKILLPAFTYVISKINDAIKSFKSLSTENKNLVIAIASVAAAIGPLLYTWGKLTEVYKLAAVPIARLISLYAAQKLAAEAAGTAALTAGEFVSQSFKKALIASGPYIAAFAAIGVAIYAIYTQLNKTNEELVDFNKYSSEATTELSKQRSETDALISVIKDENATRQDKIGALNKLQDISPEYFKNLSIEKSSVEQITAAYDDYIANITRSIKANLAKGDLEKQLIKEEELLQKVNKANELIAKAQTTRAAGSAGTGGAQVVSNEQAFKKEREAYLAQLEVVQKNIKETEKYIVSNTNLSTSVGKVNTEVTTTSGKLSDFDKELQKINESFKDVQQLFDAGLISRSDAASKQIEILNNKMNLLATDGVEKGRLSLSQVTTEIQKLQVEANKLEQQTILPKLPAIEQRELLPTNNINEVTFGGASATTLAIDKILESSKGKVQKYYQDLGVGFQTAAGTFKNYAAEVSQVVVNVGSFAASSLQDSFSLIGETIGQAFVGPVSFKSFFNSILSIVADFAKTFGKQLVALGIAKTSLDKLFASIGGGPVAIAAGIALIAAASALSASLNKSIPSLAIGTDMVKSDGIAMIHKGEAVVPANVVKGGFTGARNNVNITGRIQGTDLILVSDYAMAFKTRIR